MDISTITGSRSPADNVTSFYTFALGVVAGGFLAVLIGTFDAAMELKGDLLRVYLALVTAMLGGGIGLFASRLGDRIADRRQTRRKIYVATLRMRHLGYEIVEFATDALAVLAAPPPALLLSAHIRAKLLARATNIGMAARALPDFDAIIDGTDDTLPAIQAASIFQKLQATFPAELPGIDSPEGIHLLAGVIQSQSIDGLQRQFNTLREVISYFEKRADS